MFDIYLTTEVVPESDGHAVYGRIQIEDYTETFIASLVCWSRVDYEEHWHEACQLLIEGMPQSALLISYVEPSMSEFFVWWPLCRDDQVVHVRNEIVPYSQLTKPFSINDPWSSICGAFVGNGVFDPYAKENTRWQRSETAGISHHKRRWQS